MRRLLPVLSALLISVLSPAASWQRVRDLDIHVTLLSLGGAVFHEKWDLNTGDDITEWYLVRENLGDMELVRLQVLDENGNEFADDGEWDVHRTLAEKAGKSGVVHKANGLELCWGVGTHGDHVFHAFYSFTNAVKSLNDYDMFHMQLVSPGLSSPPEHVRVTIEAKGQQLDTLNTRIWGFGYEGTSAFQEDGTVVFESSGPFLVDDSVIVLLRFEKGMFSSESIQERDFQDALDQAMIDADFGHDYYEEEDDTAAGIAGFFTILVMYFAFLRPFVKALRGKKSKREISKVIGVRDPKTVSWFRDIPMGGYLGAADCVLKDIGEGKGNNLALAIILRLVHTGYLRPTREIEGPLQLAFTDKDPQSLDNISLPFYRLLEQAAGEDKVLQDKEFSAWASAHSSSVYKWTSNSATEARSRMNIEGWYCRGKYTDEGKAQARNVVGFKNFLNDFTLSSQRETFEAQLWKEYLVYAALFGIADKVASQLKDIDPSFFRETFAYDADMLPQLLTTSRAFASAISSAAWRGTPSSSYSSGSSGSSYRSSHGYGGHSSRSGGGGYSGGGRGGGGR